MGKKKALTKLQVALCAAFAAGHAMADGVLPTNGTIVGGSGSISRAGSSMTVLQSSSRMAIDWQSFSIGHGSSVRFVQPSASAVALNRVTGSEVSVIQGSLSANGHVFLVNPNGVLFTPTAQVNVGALVASTLAIEPADFMAGGLRFEGDSPNAVVNQGLLSAAPGGTVALIAAKVSNEGEISAPGGRVLLGAGSRVTLDLGGPVQLVVERGALDALIEQGGAIRADGGLVYLSARAAGDLASTVINHTGITEARTLASGERGEIYLLGDMAHGAIRVGGTLDASAPSGGRGGFIETSAASVQAQPGLRVTAASASGEAGTWLIDPTDITIGATSCSGTNCIAANTIADTLNGGTDVTIATAAGGGEPGNITVDAPIAWTSSRLTLSAHNDILVNATLDAGGSASLAFEYGQATENGGAATYTVAPEAKIYVPGAGAFTWKKGSEGAVRNLVLDNGLLRFGNGTQASINANGQLEQPFYFDNTSVVNGTPRNGWYKLTYSNYPLDLELGVGGDGTSSWNRNGALLSTDEYGMYYDPSIGYLGNAIVARSLEISKYREGTGSVVSSVDLDFGDGAALRVENTYTLQAGASYVKTDTKITNVGADSASNVRVWVGTRDDYIALSDRPYKARGNLTADGFEQLAEQAGQSRALRITERNDGQGAAVLFYSTSEDADTSFSFCCSFTNATGIDPRSSEISAGPTDGSYALFMRLPDLASGESAGLTWYYAAGPAATLDSVVREVTDDAGVTTPVPPPSAPAPSSPAEPLVAAVHSAQQTSSLAAGLQETVGGSTAGPTPPPAQTVGSLEVVEVPELPAGTDVAAAGPLKVFVVQGGVHLPEEAEVSK